MPPAEARTAEVVEGEAVARPLARPDPEDAVVAPGDLAPLEDDRPADLREGEGQHREVDPGQAHAEPAEDESEHPGHRGGEEERDLHRGARVLDEEGGRVRAPAEEGGVPERDHAARAHREVQARREQGHDRDLDREDQGEVVRECGEGEQRPRGVPAPPPGAGAGAGGGAAPGGPTCPCCPGASGRPRSPHGRKMRTTAITTNMSTRVLWGMTRIPNAPSSEMSTAARNAPGDAPHARPPPPPRRRRRGC